MGYSERFCQLCGISFNVGRIRKPDEPIEAAWDYNGSGVVESDMSGCEAEECQNIARIQAAYEYHDGSVREAEEIEEHLAGTACTSTSGYSGHRISVEEMKDCTKVQCLMNKADDWNPEPGDELFELEASSTWLTGISKGPADEFEIHGLSPVKHGVANTPISNCNEPDPEYGTPMHPACFQIFKRMSIDRFGKVEIDKLRYLWMQVHHFCIRFSGFPVSSDVDIVSDQFYRCVPGTEYLVAHPIDIPGLQPLIQSCYDENQATSEVVFDTRGEVKYSFDPFATLSPELKLMLVLQLSRRDVANLRLASRSFQQLHQSYFHQVVVREMPWILWDIETLPPKQVDWYKLWCKLSAADGGYQADQFEREWLEKAEWPSTNWPMLFDGLTMDERDRFAILPLKSARYKVPREQEMKMTAVATERTEAGKHWPKNAELKGLRNRRRIYRDVNEILQRIAALDFASPDTDHDQ